MIITNSVRLATMMPENFLFKIELSDAASRQILLIADNDYTLEGKKFRLKIGGKGCDGFTYEMGFDEIKVDDHILPYNTSHGRLEIILDPFTAFYCQEGNLDFFFNPNSDEDGFLFLNHNEDKYVGKFFKDSTLLPKEVK